MTIGATSSALPRVAAKPAASNELTADQEKQLREMKQRDREVRAHEQAHLASGGQHVRGGPSYSYQRGPDGRNYAVGGEVQIDTSSVAGDPEATLRKMQQVQRAALAPVEPSAQDRGVAAQAAATAARAELEMRKTEDEAANGDSRQDANRNSPDPALRAYAGVAAEPTNPGDLLDLTA